MLVALLTSMLVTALVLMLAFPQTPTGRWLHRIVVQPLARFFGYFTWAKLARLLISLAVVMFLISIGPEGIALLTAAGVDAAMLEVILAIWLVSASGNIAGAWRSTMRVAAKSAQAVRSIVAPHNRQRSSRRRKVRPQRKNDDQEPGWAFAWSAVGRIPSTALVVRRA